MKYAWIDRNRLAWPVSMVCEQLGVSISGYHQYVRRKVLAWRVSSTMSTDACTDALEEAVARYGRPEIFNTDQGSQFTSDALTGILKANSIQISMDGKGRWMVP